MDKLNITNEIELIYRAISLIEMIQAENYDIELYKAIEHLDNWIFKYIDDGGTAA